MTSVIERDFVVKNGVVSSPMKERPNYCGIEDIGYKYNNACQLEFDSLLAFLPCPNAVMLYFAWKMGRCRT